MICVHDEVRDFVKLYIYNLPRGVCVLPGYYVFITTTYIINHLGQLSLSSFQGRKIDCQTACMPAVIGLHNLRMLSHNRCKWHSAEKRHDEDASADENCVCVNKRSIAFHTNKK